MLGDPESVFAAPLQDALEHRMETLQAVLMGEMNPLERRIELAKRRPGIVSRATADQVTKSSLEDEVDEGSSDEQDEQEDKSEQDSLGFKTADSVEVRVESPGEDQIRVANYLAEKYSDAKSIAISSENSVEVRQKYRGSFLVDVADVLEREFDEDRGSETTDSSAPSMSTAAEQKLG